MNDKLAPLSPQMEAILRLLEEKGAIGVRELNRELYRSVSPRNRRAFAASMSRTIHRMEWRGLIVREGGEIRITDAGLFRIHPEQFQALLEEI